MAAKRARKPKPVPAPVTTVCDLCGIAWSLHGSEPTSDDCIRLLKVEVAKKPPYIQPYPWPYVERPWPKEVPYWRQPGITWEAGMLNEGLTKVISSGANVTINKVVGGGEIG